MFWDNNFSRERVISQAGTWEGGQTGLQAQDEGTVESRFHLNTSTRKRQLC